MGKQVLKNENLFFFIVWGTRLMRSFLNTKKAFLFLRKAFVL